MTLDLIATCFLALLFSLGWSIGDLFSQPPESLEESIARLEAECGIGVSNE